MFLIKLRKSANGIYRNNTKVVLEKNKRFVDKRKKPILKEPNGRL
jgi:hypothetical protein